MPFLPIGLVLLSPSEPHRRVQLRAHGPLPPLPTGAPVEKPGGQEAAGEPPVGEEECEAAAAALAELFASRAAPWPR